jgi:tRNA dimethylallyltransferase
MNGTGMSKTTPEKYLISIIGPTAAGKTALSLHLAKMFGCPVLSADSRQIFKGMNIGTAKVTPAEMDGIPHYLIDELSPDQSFSAADFAERVAQLVDQIHQDRFVAILVGGSGFYLQSVWEGLDEMPEIDPAIRLGLQNELQLHGLEPLVAELAQVDPQTYGIIDQKNPARVLRALEVFRGSGIPISTFRQKRELPPKPYRLLKIGLTMDRPALYARIDERVVEMMAQGLESEARNLYNQFGGDIASMQTVGYQEFIPYFKGEYDLDRAVELIQRNSRRLAKRQYTWFRRYEDIAWFEFDQFREIEKWIWAQMGVE